MVIRNSISAYLFIYCTFRSLDISLKLLCWKGRSGFISERAFNFDVSLSVYLTIRTLTRIVPHNHESIQVNYIQDRQFEILFTVIILFIILFIKMSPKLRKSTIFGRLSVKEISKMLISVFVHICKKI